jgi:NAD(P)-dependent dehydrogenase (short-subunit alcohol dehydrogenase family)
MSSRIVITGASSGIGAATAERLRGRGHRVVGLDLHPKGTGAIACDVADQASVDAAVAEAVALLGGLDVLVNCAGLGLTQGAGEAPGPDAELVIAVNLLGPWRVTSAALAPLREARGRVVNVASGLAHLSVPFATAYCMSKRGLVGYSDTLRYEHGDALEVTTFYPGYVKTPIHDDSVEKGFGLEGLVPEEPLAAVADRLADAAVGPYRRDVASTRAGTVNYAVVDRLPRRLVDRAITWQLRRTVRRKPPRGGSPAVDRFVEAHRGR